MHTSQKKILELAETNNLAILKLREIGEKIGDPHPQKVKHHLSQLIKKGFLKFDKKNNLIVKEREGISENSLFITIPILGSANCGIAQALGEENLEGYLKISKSMLKDYQTGNLFALKAIGNSMNQAEIGAYKRSLEDGDFAIINTSYTNNLNRQYVLSIIEGLANIKKLIHDINNEQIVLLSESTEDYPPIYIHVNDFNNYFVNGIVVEVIKKPKNS